MIVFCNVKTNYMKTLILYFATAFVISPNAHIRWIVDRGMAVVVDLERENVLAVDRTDNAGHMVVFYDADQYQHNYKGVLIFRVDGYNYTLYGEQVRNQWMCAEVDDPEVALVVNAMKYGNSLSIFRDGNQIACYPLTGSARAFRLAFNK